MIFAMIVAMRDGMLRTRVKTAMVSLAVVIDSVYRKVEVGTIDLPISVV